MKSLFYLIFLLFSTISCSKYSPETRTALRLSGSNSGELEKVLQHFSNDSLKYKAAIFLIENMPGKGTVVGSMVDDYRQFIDSIYQIQLPEYDYDSYYKEFNAKSRQNSGLSFEYDLQTISSDYLIKSIDDAFEVWDLPWNRFLSIDEFCEYILPYRCDNEYLENWRGLYRSRFESAIDSSIKSSLDACIAVNNELIKYPIHVTLSAVNPSALRPSTLINMKFGLCEFWCNLAIFSMRAMGVPVGKEVILHFGRGNSSHTSNFVYNNTREYYDFSGAEDNPGNHLSRFPGIAKVHRITYEIQKNSLAIIHGTEEIPAEFSNPCIVDATGNYSFIKKSTLSLDASTIKNQFAYLCVFHPTGWKPVDWGKVENGKINFTNVGCGIIYQLCYHDQELRPAAYPFLLDSLGRVSYFQPSSNLSSVCLDRKHPCRSNLAAIPRSIIGGRFQASDNESFRHKADIFVISQEPSTKYTKIKTNVNKAYKYYRYFSSDSSRVNMAEIEFYDENSKQVKGRVIGTDSASVYYFGQSKYSVFDGDPLTFFHSKDVSSWVGMEFDKPVKIDSIRYIIRNDDNGIRKGCQYELLYMDKDGWKSLGVKVADVDDEIRYSNVPEGALYWLRNLTRGKEERIFTIEAGKQVWW